MIIRQNRLGERLLAMSLGIVLGVFVPLGPCLALEPGGTPVGLDLGSSAASSQASGSALIYVNGVPKTVNPGDALTAAEFVAVQQIMSNGKQTLLVGSNGAATGGT